MSLSNWSSKIFSQLRFKVEKSIREGCYRRSLSLRPLSGLWGLGAWIKNELYDHRLRPTYRVSAVVISVGNIVAGGSGKTPLVGMLAQSLKNIGPIAIISRGYRAKRSGLILGDELTMLSRHFPEALCLVNPDRVAAAKEAVSRGARLIILDDAFQHRRLHRDFDLVVIDAANPFGYGAFLPRGLLRDHPRRLKQADAIFVNGILSQQHSSDLQAYSDAPQIGVDLCLQRIVNLQGREQTLSAGCKIGAFCAIGQPRRFFQSLDKLHVQMVDRFILPDHEKFDLPQIEGFSHRCRQLGATALICTEKDAVKIPVDCTALPIYYLEMQFQIVSQEANWQNLIEKIYRMSRSL